MEDEELSELIGGAAKSAAGRVRDERKRRGWSQQALARKMRLHGVDWHQTTVAKVESSTRPRVLTLTESVALAAVFGWPRLDWLIAPDLVAALRDHWTGQQIKGMREEMEAISDALREVHVDDEDQRRFMSTFSTALEDGLSQSAAESTAETDDAHRLKKLAETLDSMRRNLADLEDRT